MSQGHGEGYTNNCYTDWSITTPPDPVSAGR